jgi:type I restriction enzyme S subunit
MGTGGLLCYTYNYCKDKINPSKIYGCELEKDTIKFGSASLMLVTNQYNSNINRCNSLIENPYLFNKEEDKFDIIFINPPFGSKNNYKSLNKLFINYKNKIIPRPEFNGNSKIEFKDIYPIVSNTGTELFIQLVIYSLKKDGLACIILPDGELMTSNNMSIRKYILDNCQILKVITIQGGTFTNTGIKTKALIIKKCNNDNYNQEIEFIELNKEVKVLGIRKLNEKLQFNFEDIKEETINYNTDIEIKTLGEIFILNGNGSTNSKDITNTGEYPFYRASCNNPSGTHNSYDFDGKEYLLIIKSGGCANKPISSDYGIGKVFIVNGKCAANIAVFQLNLKLEELYNIKYLYYYLLHNQSYIQKLAIYCTNNGNINMKDLMNMKIPIPSIEIQNKIVEYLDMIYEEVIKTNNEKIENIKKLNKSYLDLNLQFNKDIEIKILGEICDIENGKRIVKDQVETGEYPVLGGGGFTSFYTNIYTREGKTCKISREGMSLHNCVMILNQKYYLNSQAFTIISNNHNLINDYLWYYLDSIKEQIFNCGRGTAQKAIDIDKFKLMKIPIPSIEKQKEIVEYLEFNDNLIKTLETENEINKNNAELLMKQILYK